MAANKSSQGFRYPCGVIAETTSLMPLCLYVVLSALHGCSRKVGGGAHQMAMGPFRARISGVPNTDGIFTSEICTIRGVFGKWLVLEIPTGHCKTNF